MRDPISALLLAHVLVIALPLSSAEAALKRARRLGLEEPEALPAFGVAGR